MNLTGLQPGRNYVYVVESTDALGNKFSSSTFSFETEIHIQLYEGWNMISIPPYLSVMNTEDVFASIDGDYDIVQTYIAFDPDDPWKHYKVGKPYGNDLPYITDLMGLWIHIKNATTFIPDHKDPTTDPWFTHTPIELDVGWNFISYPSVKPRLIDNALSGVPYDMVQTYDAATGQWLSYNGTSGTLTQMEMGRGYWIHCTSSYIWNVYYA